ncbi:hypothetical protein CO709_17455 [Burkholderia thailandensis]|nr:hypothetical protein CO709_17455 [Burkholderia thailandensis]
MHGGTPLCCGFRPCCPVSGADRAGFKGLALHAGRISGAYRLDADDLKTFPILLRWTKVGVKDCQGCCRS